MMLKCVVLFLLVSLNAKSQTLQQQIDQLKLSQRLDSIRFAKTSEQIVNGQRFDSISRAKIIYQMQAGQKADSLKIASLNNQNILLRQKDSLLTANNKTLSAYILGLRIDSIKKTAIDKAGQKYDSLNTIDKAAQLSRIRSLELDSIYQAKQIALLQQVNSLTPIGSVRLTKIPGTLIYTLGNDSATKARDGNLTQFKWLQIQYLALRVAAIDKKLFPPAPAPPSNPVGPILVDPSIRIKQHQNE